MPSASKAKAGAAQFNVKDPKVMALAVITLLVVIVFAWRILRSGPPAIDDPALLTEGRLSELTARLQTWATAEQRLPSGLDELPKASGGIGSAKDGWGHPFVLTPGTKGEKKTSCEVRSLGADGQEGTDDDYVSEIIFGDDGYGKLGVSSSLTRRGK